MHYFLPLTGAPKAHTSAHLPHEIQPSGSITAFPLTIEIVFVGQTGTHSLQPVQLSLLIE